MKYNDIFLQNSMKQTRIATTLHGLTLKLSDFPNSYYECHCTQKKNLKQIFHHVNFCKRQNNQQISNISNGDYYS